LEPPPTATAKRAKLQSEVFPSTDAGDAHAGPSEEPASTARRCRRRSGRYRTPSRKLADAVADAAGRLIAPKRTVDGQPPCAGEGRQKKSRRLTAQLHPSIPEGSTPATPLPVHDMSSDSASPHLDPSMRRKRPRSSQIREHYLCADHWNAGNPCADHWNAGSPLASRHCSSRSMPLPPMPKSAQDFSRVGTGAGTACCPVADRPTQSCAATLCIFRLLSMLN